MIAARTARPVAIRNDRRSPSTRVPPWPSVAAAAAVARMASRPRRRVAGPGGDLREPQLPGAHAGQPGQQHGLDGEPGQQPAVPRVETSTTVTVDGTSA